MKVLIAGMGLIGGSFALALRDRGIADEILGTDSSEENAAEALRLGLADRIVAFEEGIPQADLVVLATPVDTIPLMAVKALNRVNGSQVVMDLGSIKAELCEVISMHARRGRFVAAHPMWGTEYSGPKAAQRGAFTGRSVVLCDTVRSDKDALATVEGIFRTLGSPAVYMDPEEHDLHAAYVSHISHVTSFALALTVLSAVLDGYSGARLDRALTQGPDRVADSASAGNGARIERINYLADTSANGLKQSFGLMVNYLYDPDAIETNVEAFSRDGAVVTSGAVRRAARD